MHVPSSSRLVLIGSSYQHLAYASSLGFAAVGTNNGHNGTSGLPFYNNADVVADFAYRA